MKPVYVVTLVIVVAVAAFYGVTVYQKSQPSASIDRGAGSGQTDRIGSKEGEIPQSGDLCGGTGGIGQIVSLGNKTFTIKRKDGRSQVVNLTGQSTIKTSAGFGAVSDLKTGERVTLVGGPNSDGSFTADTIVVCSGKGPETQPEQK